MVKMNATTLIILALFVSFSVALRGHPSATTPPNSARWMELMAPILSNMTLPDMTLPGTHDSGTYHLYNSIIPNNRDIPEWLQELLDYLQRNNISEPFEYIKPWAQTQTYRLYDQLVRGARFLDIRVAWNGQSFQTVHFLLGDPLDVLLDDIALFMKHFTRELLILEFGAFDNFNDNIHGKFQDLVISKLGHLLWPQENGFGTYTQMIMSGQRIVAFYNSKQYAQHPQFWDGAKLVSEWANVDNFPDLLSKELRSVEEMTGDPNVIYKLQWVLTTSATKVIDGFDPYSHYHSLYDLSKDANVHLDMFLSRTSRYRINILMLDYFEESDAVEQAKMLNLINCNDDKRFRKPSLDGNDCKHWEQAGLCKQNATVAQLCPLSCGLCKAVTGRAGSPCKSNSDCLYRNCNTIVNICLNDDPAPSGEPCGADYQCSSGQCRNNRCVGYPIGSPCLTDSNCGSGKCEAGVCSGPQQFFIIGGSFFCDANPDLSDCNLDPRGLIPVAKTLCDSKSYCVFGSKSVCSSAPLPFKSYYWVESSCSASAADCGNDTFLMFNHCGSSSVCVIGQAALCGRL